MRTLVAILALFVLCIGSALAAPTHQTYLVLSVVNRDTFVIATIKDTSLRAGHNLYCVSVGAHLGNRTISSIAYDGIHFSDGTMIRVLSRSRLAIITTK